MQFSGKHASFDALFTQSEVYISSDLRLVSSYILSANLASRMKGVLTFQGWFFPVSSVFISVAALLVGYALGFVSAVWKALIIFGFANCFVGCCHGVIS